MRGRLAASGLFTLGVLVPGAVAAGAESPAGATSYAAATGAAGATTHSGGPASRAGTTTLAPGRTVVTGDSSTFDWAEFHQNPLLTGLAVNSPLSASTAPQLGVAWATDLYGPALDSPVVAYDATLNETLAYVGTESGNVLAVNEANGQIVWSSWLGSPIRATPAVSGGAVFVGTFNSARLYKLDATTGAVDCSIVAPQPIEGTPAALTPAGGVPTVYVGTNDSQSQSGPLMAVNASNCALEWSFTGYAGIAGTWDPVAYSLDAAGEPLMVFGTADPDSALYGVDAVTGKLVWRFAVANPPPGAYDIGAGAVISPPGVNGFADGVAYVPTKLGVMYAVDLTTGLQIWSYNFNQFAGVTEGGRSTAALDGTNLVFGFASGVFDLNAVTGAEIWEYRDPSSTEALSSPAIAGSPGQEVVVVGDVAGGVDVVSLASGAQLYHYKTGGYVTSSPAVSDGNVLIASSDGFLYDFAVRGGDDATLPAAAISSPVDTAALANPNGNLTVSGTSTDSVGVAGVEVAVQTNGPDGQWWDAGSNSWTSGPVGDPAVLAAPGQTSSSWTFSFPVPPAGGTYEVTAYGVSTAGQSGISAAKVGFAVLYATKGAHIKATPSFVAPGATVTVTGSGYTKSEPITISFLGQTLVSITATAKGNIAGTKVKIPSNAVFGQTSLTARGTTSLRSATAAVTVGNSWDQAGYNAGHSGFEPNDGVLYDLVHPGGNIFVDLAWHYQSGAPVDTSPAVVDGVAYVANTAGQLIAIDVHNGAPIWTWQLPSGRAIVGSPAADPAHRLVMVGADDGTLDAVSMSTGALVWSTTVGGDVSAPALSGGEVYVTSTGGVVEAVAETTGAKTWSVVLPSPITAAPSFDGTDKVLVVGESNGEVEGLASATGAADWTFVTGGAVAAPATVSDGVAYFGSADGHVYAVSATTGSQIWSYLTKGPVSGTPVVTNQGTPGGVTEVLTGSTDGYLYYLEASGGLLLTKVNFHSPIVGEAAVKGVTILDTSSGTIGSARTYTDLDVWQYQTGAGITSAPIVDNGTVYAGAGDGNLYAFTSYGQPPA